MVEISTDQRFKVLGYTALKLFGNLGSDQNRCTRLGPCMKQQIGQETNRGNRSVFQIITEPGTVQVGTMSSARLKFHAVSESEKQGRGQT